MNKWINVGAAVAFMALAGSASGAPLTLTGPIPGNTVGPQSSSNPCIIAGTTCQQPAGFGYNNFVSNGNIDSYNMWSTTPTATLADGVQGNSYTYAQLTALSATAQFLVAIDVNTTGAKGETLELFEVWDTTTNTVIYNYVGPTNIGNVANNGNGYADWTLGLVDLSAFAGHTFAFHAQWSGASDGAESFFLVPVPGPIVGAGLPGLVLACGGLVALARRRRYNQA